MTNRLRGPLASSVGASAGVQVLNVVTGILLARGLGPTGRGELAAVMLWPALLVSLGAFGVSGALTYYTARAETPPRTALGTAALLLVGQTIVLVGAGAVVVHYVLARHGAATLQVGMVFLGFIPLFLLLDYPLSVLQGQSRFAVFNVVRVALFFLTAVMLVSFALADRLSLWTASGSYLTAYALTAGAATVAVLYKTEGSVKPDRCLARRLATFGGRSHIGFVSSMLNERLDQLVISLALAPAKLGLYVVAATLSSGAVLVSSGVALVALPSIARLEGDSERAAAAARYIRLTVGGAIVFVTPALVVTPQLLRLFFGADYLSAVTVARVLLLAGIALAVARLLSTVLKAAGRPLAAGLGDLIGLPVTAIGLATLVPFFGLTGAALVSLVAYSLSASWMLIRAARAFDVTIWVLLVGRPLVVQR